MDWLDLLAVQGILKSLLRHHSSKASILRHSAFFTVQLSHPYVTTGKTIALTRRTFIGKVTSLLLICCLGWSYTVPIHFSSFSSLSPSFLCMCTHTSYQSSLIRRQKPRELLEPIFIYKLLCIDTYMWNLEKWYR